MTDTPLFDAFDTQDAQAWWVRIQADLKGKAPNRLWWHPEEAIALAPFYTAEALEELPHYAPAQARAVTASGQRWAFRQDVPDALASADVAAWVLRAHVEGVRHLGLSLRHRPSAPFDLATVAAVVGEAGADGATHLYLVGQPPVEAWTLVEDALARADLAPSAFGGVVGDDLVGRQVRTGARTRAADYAETVYPALARVPAGWRTLVVDATPYHEAGATTTQTLAFILGAVVDQFDALTDLGAEAAALAGHLHVTVPVGSHYFLELAALRALRLLLGQVLAAYPGASAEEADRVQIEVTTSRWEQTRFAPHLNLLRATTQAMAAILGGCDVLRIHPYDALSTSASAEGARLSRTLHHLLRHEAHLGAVADPAAGAYYLEQATHQLAAAAWSLFQEIEGEGGLSAGLATGRVQQRIAEARQRQQADVATRRRVMVGTNDVPDGEAPLLGAVPPPPDTDLEIDLLPSTRATAPFEALRMRTLAQAEAGHPVPRVALVLTGSPARRTARAAFARNVFGCAGFVVLDERTAAHAEEAAAVAAHAVHTDGAALVVLCSDDAAYATLVPTVHAQLEATAPETHLVVAGAPDDRETLEAAGADLFIHRRLHLLDTLTALQDQLFDG
ncbi:MAG: methylmalonyl-CoA mutase family protein [Bacteroidota bacterium]